MFVEHCTKLSIRWSSVCLYSLGKSPPLSFIFLLFLLILGKSMTKPLKYCETQRIFSMYLLCRVKSGKLMKDTISDLTSEIYMKKREVDFWRKLINMIISFVPKFSICKMLESSLGGGTRQEDVSKYEVCVCVCFCHTNRCISSTRWQSWQILRAE